MSEIKVAEDFSATPGGRFRLHGPYSGEEFREDFLLPKIGKALSGNDTVVVNFDGVAGLPSSFLEEAFGGLVRKRPDLSLDKLNNVVSFKTTDPTLDPYLLLARRYMKEAHEKLPRR